MDDAIRTLIRDIIGDPDVDNDEPFQEAPLPEQLHNAVVENSAYRHVLYTGRHMQQVAMAIDGAVGWERHLDTSQYFAVVAGSGTLVRGRSSDRARAERVSVEPGAKWVVEPGTWHDVEGSGLKLLTIYSPPHHARGRRDETNPEE